MCIRTLMKYTRGGLLRPSTSSGIMKIYIYNDIGRGKLIIILNGNWQKSRLFSLNFVYVCVLLLPMSRSLYCCPTLFVHSASSYRVTNTKILCGKLKCIHSFGVPCTPQITKLYGTMWQRTQRTWYSMLQGLHHCINSFSLFPENNNLSGCFKLVACFMLLGVSVRVCMRGGSFANILR